jgi:hypothetical protein
MSELSDLLERFRRGGELLASATTGAAGSELDFKTSPEKWSVRQLVCHMADSELVDGMRLRLIIAEENPTLCGYDQEAWAKNLDYGKRKLSGAIETCRRLRAENYELLRELPEQTFSRIGTHVESGKRSLLDQVRNSTEHLESHVMQVKAVRAAYREQRAKAAPPAASVP